MSDINARGLWLRWVVANSIGELIGLGTTFAVGFLAFTILGEPRSVGAVIGMFLLMVATGAFEGVVVGLSQWLAMRSSFPNISRRSWVTATLLGAMVAWFLGSIPSTVMSLGAENAQAASVEPEMIIILLMAGAMGAVTGVGSRNVGLYKTRLRWAQSNRRICFSGPELVSFPIMWLR
jgi:hypothetical protein